MNMRVVKLQKERKAKQQKPLGIKMRRHLLKIFLLSQWHDKKIINCYLLKFIVLFEWKFSSFNCKRVVSTPWVSIRCVDPYIKEKSGFCNFVPYTRHKFSYKYTDIHSNLWILHSNLISNIVAGSYIGVRGAISRVKLNCRRSHSPQDKVIFSDLIRPKGRWKRSV